MAPGGPLPLAEVLRRCHRDELLPLARAIGINPAGLGRDHLAHVLETALRAIGASKVENVVLRNGEGPDYSRVVTALARRHDVTPAEDLVLTERAVLARWREEGVFERAHWDALDALLGPPATTTALARRSQTLPEALLAFANRILWVFAPLVGPFAPVLLFIWFSRPRDDLLLPAVLQIATLRERVARRFTIGVVGPPSSGKDAALGALFGIRTGNVHPVAGSTKEVTVYRLPEADGLQIVNTPGVGDVLQALTEEARGVLDQVDLFLFLVNAQGGVRLREKTEFQLCRVRRRPILVVLNKIDTLRPEDRPRLVEDVRSKLGLPPGSVLAAAFDPLPQLAPEPIGVESVRVWLRARMAEMGRDPATLPG